MVTIQSRLNQIVDETSSTGQKLLDFYQQHNIDVYDEQGQLRSLYDILTDVSEQWGNLTTNERDYYLNIQAGANQSVNLASILSNFNHVLDATQTAYNSAGSAAAENAIAVDSLAGKTQSLKAAFQDLSNAVVTNDMVKGFLDLLTKIVNAIDPTVARITLLTGVLTGLQSLAKASHIGILAQQTMTFAEALFGVGAGITSISSVAFPLITILSTLIVLGYKLHEKWKEEVETAEHAVEEIEQINAQLEENKKRLEEIDDIPWYEHTKEIENETEALKENNEELKKRKEYLERYANGAATTSNYSGPSSSQLEYGDFYVLSGEDKVFTSIEDARRYAEAIGQSANAVMQLRSTAEMTANQLANYLKPTIVELTKELNQNGIITEETQQKYKDLAPLISAVSTEDKELTNAIQNLETAYDNAYNKLDFFYKKSGLTENQVKSLKELFPELSSAIYSNGSAWGTLASSVEASTNKLINANGRIYASDKERVDKTLKLLDDLIEARRIEVEIMSVEDPTNALINTYQKDIDIYYAQWRQLLLAREEARKYGYDTPLSVDTVSTTATAQATDEALKIFQNAYKDLQHQRDMDLIDNEEYYKQLQVLVNNYTTNATANMKKYGLDTQTINRNMYQYEKEIYDGRAKLAQEYANKVKGILQDEQDRINKQTEAYNALFAMGSEIAEDRVAELQKQLDLLEAQNDAVEDAIKLQELQDRLAQAKANKLYVFKDGRYQYISDTEATASAQQELNEYERQQALQAEKDRINKQIDYWQEWSKAWSNAVSDYNKQQNDLLVLEQFGISREDANWNQRITNLQSFVNEYSDLLLKLTNVQDAISRVEAGETATISTPSTNNGITNLHDFAWKAKAGETIVAQSGLVWIKNADGTLGVVEDSKSVASPTYRAYANGTTETAGGMSLVGEHGPELRLLSHGEGILPADITKNLWSWGSITPINLLSSLSGIFKNSRGTGGQVVNIQNLNLPSIQDGQGFVDYLKNNFWRTAIQSIT